METCGGSECVRWRISRATWMLAQMAQQQLVHVSEHPPLARMWYRARTASRATETLLSPAHGIPQHDAVWPRFLRLRETRQHGHRKP